jgi:hypothetical protein
MATSYDIGHAIRRRRGISPNYLEAAGNTMNRQHATHEEGYQQAVSQDSARVPMGTSAFNVQGDEQSGDQFAGILTPRGGAQAADPAQQELGIRQHTMERLGASYQIKSLYSPPMDPTAGPTMANARIVPSVRGRNTPDFEMGEQSAYL